MRAIDPTPLLDQIEDRLLLPRQDPVHGPTTPTAVLERASLPQPLPPAMRPNVGEIQHPARAGVRPPVADRAVDQPPSCWSRSATRAGSPRAGSRAQRHRALARLDRGGAGRAGPPPLQPWRQPAGERDPSPDGGHAAALRAARAAHLRQRTRGRAPQEGGPPDPQAPPVRRHLPAHDPRPRRRPARRSPCPAPPAA